MGSNEPLKMIYLKHVDFRAYEKSNVCLFFVCFLLFLFGFFANNFFRFISESQLLFKKYSALNLGSNHVQYVILRNFIFDPVGECAVVDLAQKRQLAKGIEFGNPSHFSKCYLTMFYIVSGFLHNLSNCLKNISSYYPY